MLPFHPALKRLLSMPMTALPPLASGHRQSSRTTRCVRPIDQPLHGCACPENFSPRFPPLLQSVSLQPVSLAHGTASRRWFGRGLRTELKGSTAQPAPEAGRRKRRIAKPRW
jgi:hypothetical protein